MTKDELIDWIINNTSHPDLEKRLRELREIEIKEYAAESRQRNRSTLRPGIEEVSIFNLK